MTWPTSSKASTSNVDAAHDRISDARTDILQNIQNTNAIINKFSLTSLADGQILVATGSNTFENKDQITISPYFAYIQYGGEDSGGNDNDLEMSDGGVGEDSSSLTYRYFKPVQKFDPEDKFNFAGYDSTNDSTVVNSLFVTEAGTYSFHIQDMLGVPTDNDDPDLGIQVIKPDGTKFNNFASTTETSGDDFKFSSPNRTLAMFPHSIGIYNVSLPAQSVVRVFLTNNNDVIDGAIKKFLLKITKG